MASNRPPLPPPPNRFRPPRPYLGLPNNMLTAPTSSDPNRTIGSANMVKFNGDPREQSILFAGLWFLKLEFALEDFEKYIYGTKGSKKSRMQAKSTLLLGWQLRLTRGMLETQAVWTYIWDIVIYYDIVRGNLPSAANLCESGKMHKIFQPFFSYAVVRNMLKPFEYAIDVERIWHDKQYSHILEYVRNLWLACAVHVYSWPKTKKTATFEANPRVNQTNLRYTVMVSAYEYWNKHGMPKVDDLPCPD